MNNLIQKALSTNTINALGLKNCPFSLQENANFSFSSWQSQFQLIQHATLFSQSLMVMTGAEGSGKSTFSRQLLQHLPEAIAVSCLDAVTSSRIQSYIDALVKPLGLSNLPLETKKIVENIICKAQQLDKHSLLIVDNADLLPSTVLRFLAELVTGQKTHTRVHVLLIATPAIKLQLTKLSIAELDDLTHSFELSSYNLKEMCDYLSYRMSLAGLRGQLPLQRNLLTRLYKQSEGNIRLLHSLVIDELEALNIGRRSPAGFSLSSLLTAKTGSIAASIVGLIVIAASWVNIDNVKQKKQTLKLPLISTNYKTNKQPPPQVKERFKPTFQLTKTINLDNKPKLKSSQRSLTLPVGQVENKKVPLEPHLVAQKDKPLQDSAKHLGLKPIARDPKVTEPSDSVKLEALAGSQSSLAKAPVVLDNVVVIPKPQADKIKQAVKVKTKKYRKAKSKLSLKAKAGVKTRRSTLKRAKKAKLAKPAKQFALQILGSHQLDAVKAFMSQHRLASKAVYYKTKNKGKTWYVLMYGRYKSSAEAKQAVKHLPASVKNLSPWPRSTLPLGRANRLKHS